MQDWLEFARGPLFRAAFTFMILGLLRHVVLTIQGLRTAWKRAGDKHVPLNRALSSTVGWLFPLARLRERPVYSSLSIIFHIGLVITPIFLAGHIALWQAGLGIKWPALNNLVADVLTLVTIGSAFALMIGRLSSPESRALTRPSDLLLLALLAVVFATGYLVSHPATNPFGYSATMLFHLLAGNLVLILLPLSKLTHCVLLPLAQLVAELGWRFPADAGEKVAAALGKENEPL